MVYEILQYKWYILVFSEAAFWITFILFLLLRYWFDSRSDLIFLSLAIINQFLTIPLAAIEYIYTGQASFFHLIVLLFYIYAILRGHKDMIHLDTLMKNLAKHYHRNSERYITPLATIFQTYSYPKLLRRKFIIHFSIFLLVQILYQPSASLSSFWITFLIIDCLWSLSFSHKWFIKINRTE